MCNAVELLLLLLICHCYFGQKGALRCTLALEDGHPAGATAAVALQRRRLSP